MVCPIRSTIVRHIQSIFIRIIYTLQPAEVLAIIALEFSRRRGITHWSQRIQRLLFLLHLIIATRLVVLRLIQRRSTEPIIQLSITVVRTILGSTYSLLSRKRITAWQSTATEHLLFMDIIQLEPISAIAMPTIATMDI